MYTLQDIALGGAALTAVSSWLTQVLKKLIELRWGPKDPAHDPLVHGVSVLTAVVVVEIATLATVSAAAFSPAWWQALLTAAGLGLGIKISAQGAYALLTSGKVDALPALVGELLQAVEPPAPAADTAPPAPAALLAPAAQADVIKAASEQITAAVVAALTPAAFNPPAPPPAVTPAPTSPLIVPPGASVPVEAGTSS